MIERITITGIGILSPIGIGREAYWEGLFQGKTGFRPITLFDSALFRVHVAGEIKDFDALSFLGKKGLRDLDRSTRLICSAAKLAIDDSRLEITEDNSHSTGVSIGTTFGSLHSISQFDRSGLIDGPRFVNPSHFPNTVINSPASQVSIRFKVKGFNSTISTGFCASLDAVSYAADFIKLNRANVVLAGGAVRRDFSRFSYARLPVGDRRLGTSLLPFRCAEEWIDPIRRRGRTGP
jgi:3-oxoacyl-[acyl-carrier-protein] synthase II